MLLESIDEGEVWEISRFILKFSFIKYYQYIINIKLSLMTCLVAHGP